MKRLIYFLILTSAFLSCSNQEGYDFVGKWVEKQTEGDICEIIKNGKTYLFVDDSGRFPAEYNEGMLEISTPIGIIKGTIDKETGNLVLAGKELIRFENATKPKFVGEWQSKSSGKYGYCKIEINIISNKIELKPLEFSCSPYIFDMKYPKYNDGCIEFTRKQYDETGYSDNIKSKITLLSDNEIQISYDNNNFDPDLYVRIN